MMWFSLWVLPLLVILYFQIAFLPYHDVAITWAHRIYLFGDIVMLVLIGLFVHTPEPGYWKAMFHSLRLRPIRFILGGIGGLVAVFFSLFIATIPGEALDKFFLSLPVIKKLTVKVPAGKITRYGPQRYAFLPTAYLFEGSINR